MTLEAKKYLYDIQKAVEMIALFTTGKSWEDYENDPMLRSAVERQFEITGEALGQLAKLDPVLAARISDYRSIIAFRNMLIHGYGQVDDRIVWDVVQSKLHMLQAQVRALLQED